MAEKVNEVIASLECSVCLEKYTDRRSLPCGHSFCLDCLRPVLYRNSLRCPTCRNETNVNSVAELPKPYALLEVLSVLESVALSQTATTPSGASVTSSSSVVRRPPPVNSASGNPQVITKIITFIETRITINDQYSNNATILFIAQT